MIGSILTTDKLKYIYSIYSSQMKLRPLLIGRIATLLFIISFNQEVMAGLAPFYDYGNVIYAEPIMKTVEVMVPEQKCVPVETKIVFPAPNHLRYYVGPLAIEQETVVARTVTEIDTPTERVINRTRAGVNRVTHFVRELVVEDDIYPKPPVLVREIPQPVVEEQMACNTVPVPHKQKQFDGYKVTYIYNGQTFVIRTAERPGKQIKVLITTNVIPVVN